MKIDGYYIGNVCNKKNNEILRKNVILASIKNTSYFISLETIFNQDVLNEIRSTLCEGNGQNNLLLTMGKEAGCGDYYVRNISQIENLNKLSEDKINQLKFFEKFLKPNERSTVFKQERMR